MVNYVVHSFPMDPSARLVVPFQFKRQDSIISQPLPTASVSTTPVTTLPLTTPATTQPVTTSPPTTIATTTTPTTTTPLTTPTIIPSTSQATSISSVSSQPSSTSSIVGTTSQSTSSTASSAAQDPSISITSTDAAGQTTVIVVTSPAADSSSASPSATGSTSDGDSSIHSGTIIGLSVVGGIAAVAIISFIIWKLTRKRFSDLDDSDEAIKWPELNRDSHIDTGLNGLSRQPSNTYSSGPSRNTSALDQSEFADPYAVPPLPQLNPNQPYRDDPYAASGAAYYDPYRGPIPQTFHDDSADGHESIPMSTYPPNSRSRSPGPSVAMGGRGSPVPGRTISPGPAAALGLDRRPSPGPQYTQYAMSGQPEMAARTKSPGPNILA